MYLRMYLLIALGCVACGGDAGPVKHDASAAGSGAAIDSGVTQDAGATAVHDAGGICTYDPSSIPSDCPDSPNSCANPAASYQSDVSHVITTYCSPCHRAGGLAPDKLFDTYLQVYKQRVDMLGRFSPCVMPPACAAQPTATERTALLNWLLCGAPNN